jgi:hypothetical protein
MNILEDLPHKIEYIEPSNYIDDFVFTDLYNEFTKGMNDFLDKFIDANEKEVFEYNFNNNILEYEFIKFIRLIREKSIKET